jgi:tetratricopeptide (TPR) repeat protein
MTALASVALVVMAVTIVLAVFALISRHQAVSAQAAAERRQKQAEDLVGFMLGDLNDKLAQQSKLDIMQAVDDQAMAYFKSLPATDVSDTALAQRAKALEKIGAVRLSQGQLPGALDAFRASTQISSRLAAAAPSDVERHVAYSNTLAYIGFVYWNQGKLDAAQREWESAQQALRASQLLAKDDPLLLNQLATLEGNLGHVLEARGQPVAAETAYRKELALSEKLAALEPSNAEYASGLGGAHNDLGKLALQRGDLAEAVLEYSADDAIETRMSARNPKNNNQRQEMARSRAILGHALALTGDVQTGMRDLQQAVDITGQLLKFDPHEADVQSMFALYCARLARLRRLSGNLSSANILIARATATFSALVRKDPSNSEWQEDLAETLIEQAAQSLIANRLDAARTQSQGALHILESQTAGQPSDRYTLLLYLRSKLLLADLEADPHTALSLRGDALKIILAQKTSENDPRLLALQAEALLALGRKADAQPLIRQLWTSGYRDPGLLGLLQHERIDYPANPTFQAKLLAATGQPEKTDSDSNLQASDKPRK